MARSIWKKIPAQEGGIAPAGTPMLSAQSKIGSSGGKPPFLTWNLRRCVADREGVSPLFEPFVDIGCFYPVASAATQESLIRDRD